ncbi:hypothetical protein ACM55F_07805 [Flavobacterium sp. XS2P12]|uniref:hypothetical protein n=1 Tax=Flavobacterium melibiosi TaxID=3398734 RepID=UPI003A8A1AB1
MTKTHQRERITEAVDRQKLKHWQAKNNEGPYQGNALKTKETGVVNLPFFDIFQKRIITLKNTK